MPDTHQHHYVYPAFRLLTLEMPDHRWRILAERRCRWCPYLHQLTGSGTRGTPGRLPTLDTFWDSPRAQEDGDATL